MADRRRDSTQLRSHSDASHSVNGNRSWSDYHSVSPLIAAAQLLPHSDYRYGYSALQYDTWQEEAWDFLANLGEFAYGVDWFARALSRVRLVAAAIEPGSDEPVILDKGPAVDIIDKLGGGADGRASLMRSFATQLSVVGDCYLVGREVTEEELYGDTALDAEPDDDGSVWTVQPINTLRRSPRTIKTLFGQRRRGWQLQTDEVTWMELPRESLVTRVWDRNEHFPWRAMSPARAALPVMREIDMYNRYIMATLISRVALNGLLLIPDEVTLPVNPDYEESADPFIAELLDVMRAAIKNPGSPSSAAPLPLRAPGEQIQNFKHLTFATPLDEKIFEMRKEAIVRLAAALNLPLEIVTGLGNTSHWNSWQLEESAIKTNIAPTVETITRCITIGCLRPQLRAGDQSLVVESRSEGAKPGSKIVAWYDTSSLTQRPDRSQLALDLSKMMVINDEATRRETGFSEGDTPTDDEMNTMALRQLAVNPQTYSVALKKLTGLSIEQVQVGPQGGGPPPESGPSGGGPSSTPGVGTGERTGAPDTRSDEPSEPNEGMTASGRRDELLRRVREMNGAAQTSAIVSLIADERDRVSSETSTG